MKHKARIISLLLALVLCFSSMGITAFAKGDDPDYTVVIPGETRPPAATTAPQSTTPTTPTTPTMPVKGTGFSEDGILATRDLLYDKATNKQYIVVETRTGETFYMVIDYDKPLDEDEERYQTYFLNPVDVADLMAMMGTEETKPIVCSCIDRCVIGAVNLNCELCTQSVRNCVGKVPETTVPPTTETPAPQKSSNSNPAAMLVILLLLCGGGAYAYYAFVKKGSEDKKTGSTDLSEYDYGMGEDEDYQEFEKSEEAEDE